MSADSVPPRRSDVLHDLITAFLVAVAALIASGLLDRIWIGALTATVGHSA